MKGFVLLVALLALVNAASGGPCSGLPYANGQCPGTGFTAPAHLAALFASSVLTSNVTMSFNINTCPNNQWCQIMFRWVENSGTNYQYFLYQVFALTATNIQLSTGMPNADTYFEWNVFRECWKPPAGNTSSPLPPGSANSNGWSGSAQCWVQDTTPGRTGFLCVRGFYFCTRQADNTLVSPYPGTVFQSVSSISFSWSDITPSEPNCLSQATSFAYQLCIFNTTNILNTAPLVCVGQLVSSGSSYTTSFPNGTPAGTYYWTVRSTRVVSSSNLADRAVTTTTTQFASPWSFRLCTANVAPTTPTTSSPTSGQSIHSASYTITASGPSVAVFFSWGESDWGYSCNPGTNSYSVVIASNSALTLNVTSFSTQGTNSTVLLTDGTWFWGVTASNGVTSTSNIPISFSTCSLLPPKAFSTINPTSNQQSINYTSIAFQWGTSSPTATCATPGVVNYTMAIGASSSQLFTNYTGTSLIYTAPFYKGTWYWTVTATDSNGQSTVTPVATFVTLSSLCTNSTPSAVVLGTVSYQYTGGMQVTLNWASPNLGVSCTNSTTPSFTLTVTGPGSVVTTYPLPSITTLSYVLPLAVTTSVGTYQWSLSVTNAAGISSGSSSTGSFVICDLSALTGYATSFSPLNNALDTDKSITAISWEFNADPTQCLGGTMVFSLKITGLTTIVTPYSSVTTNTPYSYSVVGFQPGTWSWTLSADVSQIPLPNLPSPVSYSGQFSICLPAYPNAPTLGYPARFSQLTGNSTSLQWSDPHDIVDTCTVYYSQGMMDELYTYSLYTSPTSTIRSTPVYRTSVYRNGTTAFSTPVQGLAPGLLYWQVAVIKQVLVGSQVTSTLSRSSITNVFTVCVNEPPNQPNILLPLDGTVFQRCNITTNFQWDHMYSEDFGVDCSATPTSGLRIFLGTSPSSMTPHLDVLPTQDGSGLQSIVNSNFLPNTVYYWQVEAYNTNFTNSSDVFSFTTPDFSKTACSGHGTCNVQGTCSCSSGYDGDLCDNALPTQSQPDVSPTPPGEAPVGLIIGVVVGGLVLFLLLTIFGFIFLGRRVQKSLEKPVRQPPPFPPIAFTVPTGFPPLATEKVVPWYSFEQLLVVYDFAVPFAILAITQATEVDDVVKSLVYIIESHGQGANFVKALITKDLKEKKDANTLSSATLFRDNSHASKAFKSYAKIVGLPYLFYVLSDAVYDLCTRDLTPDDLAKEGTRKKSGSSRKKGGSEIELNQVVVRRNSFGQNMLFDAGNFELDPNKMAGDDDIFSNALFLQLKCQKLLVRLFRSTDIFPASFTDIFIHLMSEVESNLTREDGYSAIAAFIFLRLVNPAILFPNQYGLTDAAPGDEGITRRLILITKVLQNLANGVHFGGKEQHMAPLNDIIDSNKEQLRNFLDSVISVRGAEGSLEEMTAGPRIPKAFHSLSKVVAPKKTTKEDDFFRPLEVPRPIIETSLTVVYNQLHRNKEKSLGHLKDYRSSDDVKIMSNKVNAIIDAIGEPVARNAGTNKD